MQKLTRRFDFSTLWSSLFSSLILLNMYLTVSTSQFVSTSEERGMLIVPGLGRPDRLQVVYDNIMTLLPPLNNEKKSIHWDCVIYVYTSRQDINFWTAPDHVQKWRVLSQRCSIIENIGKKVTENIYMLQPALLRSAYKYVFLILDDIKAPARPPGSLLAQMVDLLKCNKLTILSPMVQGANKGGGQKFRNIMQTPAQQNTLGYVSSFVEIFAWLMTMPAYEALWELLSPEVNPYAWGYDFWYNGYARQRVPGHRMGILSTVVFTHEQDVTGRGGGRTDNTRVEDKWNAVMAQERHYQKYLNISLTKCRKNLELSNTSWNGAVKDYLYACPPAFQ